MSALTVNLVNFGFTWLIAALSALGYLLTIKRTGQRWTLWIVMATGWALLAIPYTLLLMGYSIGTAEMTVIWLCSYLLVMASLLLLFLKLTDILKNRAS